MKRSLTMDGKTNTSRCELLFEKNSNMAADILNETEIVNCAIKDSLFYFYLQLQLFANLKKFFYRCDI